MLRVNDTDSGLVRNFKNYYNKHHERQGKYMRFNMVDKFNDYTFFCATRRVSEDAVN